MTGEFTGGTPADPEVTMPVASTVIAAALEAADGQALVVAEAAVVDEAPAAEAQQDSGHYCPEYHAILISGAMLDDPANKALWPGEGYIEAQRQRVQRACVAFRLASQNCNGIDENGGCPVSAGAWGAVDILGGQPNTVYDIPRARPRAPIGFRPPEQDA